MSAAKSETGLQLFARLGRRPSLENIEPAIFADGINPKDVIEVYGDDGVGKTQLLLHLIANCILPKSIEELEIGGLECSVVFIDTDFHLSMIRLTAVLEARLSEMRRNHTDKIKNINIEGVISSCLDRLYVVKCNASSELVLTLFSLETVLANKLNINLLMVDSISAFYWMDRGSSESQFLQESNQKHVAAAIEKLVTSFKVVVIVTKLALFKKKGKLADPDRSPFVNEPDSTACGHSLALDEHNEFMSADWQKLVTHRIAMHRSAMNQHESNCKFCLVYKSLSGQQKRTVECVIDKQGLTFQQAKASKSSDS